MRFNAAGDAATGVGYGAIGINGATPAALAGVLGGGGSYHGPSWLTPTTIVYQSGGVGGTSPAVLESYDTVTHLRATVDANANNDCAAGNGIWALYRAGFGVKSNNGLGTMPGTGLGDVSQDFGELVKINTFPNVIGLTVYNSVGSSVLSRPKNVLTNPIVRMRGHVVAYQNQGAWIVEKVPGSLTYAARIQEPINWITPVVLASGECLVLERADRLLLRYARNGTGWIIMPPGLENQFNPDVVEVSPGVVRVGWCLNAGESPDSLRLAELTIATNSIRYASVVGGVLVFGVASTLTRVTFPVGPAGVTTNGASGPTDTSSLLVPYKEQVTDPNGLITSPYHRLLQAHSNLIEGLGATVAGIPPASATSPYAPPTGITDLTGDVAATGPGSSVATIANEAVSYAKMQNVSAGSRLLGRGSSGAGDVEEISLDSSLTMTGTTLVSSGGGASTHYDCPLSDGDLVAANLIFAAGECIIVQVPV